MGGPRHAQSERTLRALDAFYGSGGPRRREGSAAEPPGERSVLELFQSVARDVPAYRRVLESHGIAASSITTLDEFRSLPILTKDNYYRQNTLPDLCRHGRLEACDMVALSTGSTGEPAAWPRFVADELLSAARFEQVLADGFDARRRRTLAVVCFALGNWVGGIYTLGCCRHLASKGHPITVAAPGNNPAEILRALRVLSPHFEQRVLLGYPPFLRDVIERAAGDGFDWGATPTRLVMAGEVFSEEWRDWVCHRLGMTEPARATASLYGTADAGVLANETPRSIRIRRALARRPEAARALFGEPRLPTLCQYDPEQRYFEVEDGWLIFSSDGGAPLVRYKILDRGGLVSAAEMRSFLAAHAIDIEPEGEPAGSPNHDAGQDTDLPFVYIFGRSHFAVSFYGANLYPENVAAAVEQPDLAPALSGKFVLEVRSGADEAAELALTVELAPKSHGGGELARQIAERVRAELERQNSEFAHYVPDVRRTPRVELRPFGDPEYFPSGVKHRYTRA